ncbi:MAG TPA: prolyl oligopeptidase family serine peptidase [Gemmatimonadaceae bacterium]|nr:prolyl oligopeptidase family serine peptidase [Gemmatimonadaceae bacterium]
MQTRNLLLASALTVGGAAGLVAQQKPAFDFTIANIMRGPEIYGREPANVRWTLDGKWVYFTWLEPGSDWRLPARIFRVSTAPGAKPERVLQGAPEPVFADAGRPSPDGRTRLVATGGTITIVDVGSGARRVLTRSTVPKTNVGFSAGGRDVLYTEGNNAFALSLDSTSTRQLTDIRLASADSAQGSVLQAGGARGGGGRGGRGALNDAGRSNDASSQRGVLAAQQKTLFQVVRDRAFQDSVNRAQGGRAGGGGGRGGRGGGGGATDGDAGIGVRAFSLTGTDRVGGLVVAPSEHAALLTVITPSTTTATQTLVPSWVTSSGYVEEINGRPKVGDAPAGVTRIGLMSLPSGDVKWVTVSPPGRATTSNVVGWNETGTAALVFSNSADFKDRWLYAVSADSGKATLLETLHDSAWVGGPCNRCAGFFDGGRRAYYVSEADGYAHLYSIGVDGGDRRQLTKGKWEVTGVSLSRDGKSFFLTTSEQSPFESHFYKMSVDGGARVKITGPVGGHAVTLSPDESMIADIYSTTSRPPELFIASSTPGSEMRQVTTSPTDAFLAFHWMKPEIVMVPASDGIQVPARIFRPREMNAKPNGAAVIFVHGAGYLHNVMNYWTSSYPREFLFNQYLASKGYAVMDLDYRGSAGYGRDWRTAIYRWMGGRDLQDQVDGVKYLRKNYGIDPERVGIYGGSYGGFMTLMALFTEPKYFGAGAALRSVTDWAHYNHNYTAAILNLPEQDTLAYRRSSPIFFAEGLEDPLLMLHGMVDTNVEFEDIVRLTQRLIELGKKNWSLAPYPVEDHGFVRPDSWTDEYTRIFDLFESTIRVGKKRMASP